MTAFYMRGTLALKELKKVDCFSYRSSHLRCSVKKVVVLESLFNKVAGLQASNFIAKRLQHRFSPVHIANFYLQTYIWIYIEFISAKFWNLRTASSDYSFILVIYLFSDVSFQQWRKTMIFYPSFVVKKYSLKLDLWF